MYKHHGILYPTPALAIAASIYDYVTACGNNSLREAYDVAKMPAQALKAEMESNDWTSCEGDEGDWQAAHLSVLRHLQDEIG